MKNKYNYIDYNFRYRKYKGDGTVKVITSFVSSGKGFTILRNCLLGAWVLMFSFKHKSIYTSRSGSEIADIIAGLSIIFLSLYYSVIRKEKNVVLGIPTWVFGVLLLIIGMVLLYKKSLF